MDDSQVLKALRTAAAEGREVVLATVVDARGSTPRGAGSKMLIDPAEGLIGTIGGGCGEADVLEIAEDVSRTGEPRIVRVELMDDVDSWSPAVCGGIMDVFVEPVAARRPAGQDT